MTTDTILILASMAGYVGLCCWLVRLCSIEAAADRAAETHIEWLERQ